MHNESNFSLLEKPLVHNVDLSIQVINSMSICQCNTETFQSIVENPSGDDAI